jgi:hypothetical protein
MANQELDAQLRESENPYEMIVLAALEAGRINAGRLAPSDQKATSMAIERVARGETKMAVAVLAPASLDASEEQESKPAA